MKRIQKRAEPSALTEFRVGQSPDWKASFSALDAATKTALKSALLDEQGHVCCYCCGRIDEKASHIEHYLSQDSYPDLDLDYGNLLASCNSQGRDRHCGARKGNQRIEVSPLEDDCEIQFRFGLDGGIAGAASEARIAIERLGLDTRLLKENRRQAIGVFTEEIDQLPSRSIQALAEGLRKRDSSGKYEAYLPAILQALASFI